MHHGHSKHAAFEDALDGVDPISLEAFRAFRRSMYTHKMLLMRKLTEKGTHPGQAMCLWIVAHREGITQRELAEAMGVTRPTVNIMLKKMEKAGIVERVIDAEDQRYTRIRITEAGRALNDDLRSVHVDIIESTLGSLGEDDRRELTRLLHALSDHATEAMTPADTEDGESR